MKLNAGWHKGYDKTFFGFKTIYCHLYRIFFIEHSQNRRRGNDIKICIDKTSISSPFHRVKRLWAYTQCNWGSQRLLSESHASLVTHNLGWNTIGNVGMRTHGHTVENCILEKHADELSCYTNSVSDDALRMQSIHLQKRGSSTVLTFSTGK